MGNVIYRSVIVIIFFIVGDLAIVMCNSCYSDFVLLHNLNSVFSKSILIDVVAGDMSCEIMKLCRYVGQSM